MKACSAIVHVGPTLGARFTEYTAEFEEGGELGTTSAQRFVFVIEGSVKVEVKGKASKLSARGYAYFPQGMPHRVLGAKRSRVVEIGRAHV